VARAEAYLHAKFHRDPSNRLATVHQRHRQDRTDRTDRQDRQTDRQTDRQRSDSIARTVLVTVAFLRLVEIFLLTYLQTVAQLLQYSGRLPEGINNPSKLVAWVGPMYV